jgi:hypothetical protein
MNHPSVLKLEAHLLEPARSPIAGHLATCEHCREQLAGMQRQGDDFMRFVYPATVEALEPKRSPRWTWAGFFAPVAALAAAAVVMIVQTSPAKEKAGPPEDYTGTKGVSLLKLNVYAGLELGARALSDRDQVPANAALRFRIQPGRPCNLGIVSVDEHGQVSRLFPESGNEGARLAKVEVLPGGAILDGKPGPERIFAVCSADPLAMPQVEAAVKVAAGASADSVRAVETIPGLPAGTAQTTLLLEKTP